MTLEEMKAQHPEVYAAARADGVKAERDRVAEFAHWKGISGAIDSVVDEALASGKTYTEVASQLSAAQARGPSAKGNDNPPAVIAGEPAKPASPVAGMSDKDIADLKAMGLTDEEIKAHAPKEA